jgi:hypothetical protein
MKNAELQRSLDKVSPGEKDLADQLEKTKLNLAEARSKLDKIKTAIQD